MFWNIIYFSCTPKMTQDSAEQEDTFQTATPESPPSTAPEPTTDPEPTSEATTEPSTEASTEPTAEPAQAPTSQPTSEPEPTSEPTTEPQFDFPRLRFELTWLHAGDDMDLHLLNGNDASLLLSDHDCYYDNCSNGLDWGILGEENDNPLLLQHDDLGIGPEITTINQPHSGAIYTVYVHDYPESFFDFDHYVTARIILDGVELCQTTKMVSIEDSMTAFLEFDWDTQSCTTL